MAQNIGPTKNSISCLISVWLILLKPKKLPIHSVFLSKMAFIFFMGEFFSLDFFENAPTISLIYFHYLGTLPLAQSPLPLLDKIFLLANTPNELVWVAFILKPLAQEFKSMWKTGTKSPSQLHNVPFPT